MTPKNAVSIGDIQRELNCSPDRATEIMLQELPHMNIGAPGAKRPTWRAKRRDFEAWLASRQVAAGMDTQKEFERLYMGRRY